MNKQEIQEFIESMEEIGDIWEEADVERVYGSMSLEDALKDRRSSVGTFFDIIGKVINRKES
ncbi:MAG: hypothetical protein RR224_12475 [Clostridia bacterium]